MNIWICFESEKYQMNIEQMNNHASFTSIHVYRVYCILFPLGLGQIERY